jgi:Right handed beta helix region
MTARWSGSWLAAILLSMLPLATSTPAPTSAPTPTPTPVCGSLQALVDAAPTGSVVTAPACTYRETVTIGKPLTLRGYGATISGKDAAGTTIRSAWVVVNASDVTVEGFTMRDANNAAQTGAVRVQAGISRFTLRDCDLAYAAGADVSIGVANNSLIENCAIHAAGQLGVHVGGDGTNGRDNVVRNNRIYANNTAGFDPGWEAGGLKATRQTDLRLEANDVYDNAGPGLWCDISCHGTVYRANRVHGNSRAGIFEEISFDALITDNVVWNNGWGDHRGWGWPAGILVSSSRGTLVSNNVVAWNPIGISVVSQDRDYESAPYVGIRVAGNVVAAASGSRLVGWFEDWSGRLFDGGNVGTDNRYWAAGPEPATCRFEWHGCLASLAAFAATPGGGGTYLTDSEKDALLRNAGIPGAGAVVVNAGPSRRAVAVGGVLAAVAVTAFAILVLRGRRARSSGPEA